MLKKEYLFFLKCLGIIIIINMLIIFIIIMHETYKDNNIFINEEYLILLNNIIILFNNIIHVKDIIINIIIKININELYSSLNESNINLWLYIFINNIFYWNIRLYLLENIELIKNIYLNILYLWWVISVLYNYWKINKEDSSKGKISILSLFMLKLIFWIIIFSIFFIYMLIFHVCYTWKFYGWECIEEVFHIPSYIDIAWNWVLDILYYIIEYGFLDIAFIIFVWFGIMVTFIRIYDKEQK